MTRTPGEISDWIVGQVAAMTGVPPEKVDPDAPLTRHGLDSVAVVTLVSELETWTSYRFRENPLDRYPTIGAISEYLAAQLAQDLAKPSPK